MNNEHTELENVTGQLATVVGGAGGAKKPIGFRPSAARAAGKGFFQKAKTAVSNTWNKVENLTDRGGKFIEGVAKIGAGGYLGKKLIDHVGGKSNEQAAPPPP